MFGRMNDNEFCEELNRLLSRYSSKEHNIEVILTEFFNRSYSAIKQRYRRYTRNTIFTRHDEIILEKAKEMLKENDCLSVMIDLGFRYESYFARWFRKHTGMNPSVYRESFAQ